MLTTTLSKDYSQYPHEQVACPLCNSFNDHVLAMKGYPGIPLRNVICKNCGLIRINPRMTKEGYENFYREDFFEYLNPYERPAYVETIERTTEEGFQTPFERFTLPYMLPYVKQGGRVLDVGAGFGQVLYLLKRERDIVPFGMEPDPYSRALAKEKMGMELEDETIEEFLVRSQDTFDFIILDQVFEHLLAPLEILMQLAERLTPEGVIYIGVPGTYNPAVPMSLFYQLAHTYNYTPATMRLFAEKAGLKVISVRDPEGPILEVLLARKGSSYPQEDASRMIQGTYWRDVTRRLRRKKALNIVRGIGKKVATAILGTNGKEKLRASIDRLIRYRY
jgi:SAM-dependent methyltransferase